MFRGFPLSLLARTICVNNMEGKSEIKQVLSDILLVISWREIARQYFGKSSSWLYHKMDGINGNGSKGGFTEAEKAKLKESLLNLSERIRSAAEEI